MRKINKLFNIVLLSIVLSACYAPSSMAGWISSPPVDTSNLVETGSSASLGDIELTGANGGLHKNNDTSILHLEGGSTNITGGTILLYGNSYSTSTYQGRISLFTDSKNKLIVDATGVTIDDDLVSTKPCAAGYTRVTPNYCKRTALTDTNANVSSTCQSIAAPAGASYVVIQTDAQAYTNNVIGSKGAYIRYYVTNTCSTTTYDGASAYGYEFVATASQILAKNTKTNIRVPTSGAIYYKGFSSTGSSLVTYNILGYYD